MSTPHADEPWEVEVPAGDLRIPEAELVRRGLRPGQHVRLVPSDASASTHGSTRGSLVGKVKHIPTWEDFEAAHDEILDAVAHHR